MGLTHKPHGISSFGFVQLGTLAMSVRAANEGGVFFVDGTYGNDSNDGNAPDHAKKTIQAALDVCEHDRGDYVFVGEGKYSEQVTITKRGVHLIGMGADRTWIAPASAASMSTVDVYVKPCVAIYPTYAAGKCSGVELAGFRISGNGGYSGVYAGDGAAGGANASFTYIHDNVIDGSSLEGYVGILIRGGSYIRIVDNDILSWLYAGVIIGSGATRTAFGNRVHHNWISGGGVGISINQSSNSNIITENYIFDDSGNALGATIQVAQVNTGITTMAACSGTCNFQARNCIGSAGTEVTLGASDFGSTNFLSRAGNASTFVSEA